MNTAFLDAQNLAWKIHAVEAGLADRSLLRTYETERRAVAESLLDFDNAYAALFSQRQPTAGEVGQAHHEEAARQHGGAKNVGNEQPEEEPNKFVELFKSSCEFTSGYGVAYGPNNVNWSPSHPARSPLFLRYPETTRLRTGRILPPADVTRVADANAVQLENEIPVNGAFRIYVFAGEPATTRRAIFDLAAGLERRSSFLRAFGLVDAAAVVSHHERHILHSRFFVLCTIYSASRVDIELGTVDGAGGNSVTATVPPLLASYRAHVYVDDRPDRRVPKAKAAAHAKMGLDEQRGGVVVVRPDGYVGCVVALAEGTGTADALDEYFDSFAAKRIGSGVAQAQASL